MSWSLKLQNGDLTLGEARLGVVTGQAKLVQDLRCALLERMGTDPSHPGFGSLLDGGTTPEGEEVSSPIGRYDWDRVMVEVEGEIRRIEREHQARQLARIESDKFSYQRPTLTPSETLTSISQINMTQVGDTLVVSIMLSTGEDDVIPLQIPIGTGS